MNANDTPKTLDEMDARGEIYWSPTGNPRRKIYLDKSEGVPIQDIWYDFRDTRNQNVYITGYPTEKNPHVLERIIQASSNPGDLVLDCFSGSGTTLAVADVLGRQWIGIDKSREAISTTLRRFTKGTERMGDFVDRATSKVLSDVSLPERQLGLFADQNHSVAEMHDRRIRNFTLYGSEDAGESLKEWRDFLES